MFRPSLQKYLQILTKLKLINVNTVCKFVYMAA